MKSKAKALKKAVRYLTEAERKEKMKNWPKSGGGKVDTVDYQRKIGRAYND